VEAGDRVLDRWQLVARVSTRDGIERWRAVATDTGEPGEILVGPRADARARAEFIDLHGVLARVRDPSLAHTLSVRPGERPVALRVPVETEGLGAVAGPLDSATVAWIGARLAPAILAAGPATRGALRTSDVALDASGHPVLAPPIEPMTRVALGSTRSVAPEAFAGQHPDGAAGLYGLGVLLYQLATGREPPTVGTRASRPPPPPPSALRHGIPEALDRAILRLLSNDPGQRAGTLPMLQDLAGPPVDLRTHARPASPASIPVATTVSASGGSGGPTPGFPAGSTSGGTGFSSGSPGGPGFSSGGPGFSSGGPGLSSGGPGAPDRNPARTRASEPDPGGLVLIDHRALAALEPARRSHAAGLAGVPVRHVDELLERSLPLILATAAGRSAAAEQAAALGRATGLPVVAATPPRVPPWIAGGMGAGLAVIPALLALLLLLVGWLPGVVGFGLIALLLLGAGGVAAVRQAAAGALHASGQASLVRTREAAAVRSGAGLLDSAWRRLAEARVELGRVDLPGAPSSDLRGALKDLEGRLEALANLSETADRTLRQVDVSALRTRLATSTAQAATDPARRAERDRLARTIADLEAVGASRAAIGPAAARIEDALSEISAVLVQFAVDEDAALARIDTVARRARSAADAAVAAEAPAAEAPAEAPDAEAPAVEADRDAEARSAEERAAQLRAAQARAGQPGSQ
jgi:hypothetical protein